MTSLWDKLSGQFRRGTLVTRLIFINAGIFLLLRLVLVVLSLMKIPGDAVLSYLELPSDTTLLLQRPWTLLSYMFVHQELMHILFNMLWLYFFGGMFLRWFNPRQLGGLYILGGLAGALFFLLFYNVLPAFEGVSSGLIGASASILALGVAVAFFRPDEPVSLFLLGTIRLKWLAIAMIVLDLISLNTSNAGGNLAHLGGALVGLIFGALLKQNLDITRWVTVFMDGIARIFKPGPKMRVTYKRSAFEKANRASDPDQAYRDRKKQEENRLDAILDKIRQSGYDSLTADEKKQLFDSSRS